MRHVECLDPRILCFVPLIPIQWGGAELDMENQDPGECVGSCLELSTERRPGRSPPGSCQLGPLAHLNKRTLRCQRADNLLALTGIGTL